MRVIKRKTLRDYWVSEPASAEELKAWFREAEHAMWRMPADVKAKYRSASILKDGRVVFNICGHNYRIVVRINYAFRIIYIRFVGTHKEYDEIDAQVI